MKRQIINIDEEKCIGCGICASACAEGAIQMVDGKARLVSEIFCDGLGACIGECPVGAITIETRDASPYSERETMEKLIPQGRNVLQSHLKHLMEHGQTNLYDEGVRVLQEKGIVIAGITDVTKTVQNPSVKEQAKKPVPDGCGCPHATQSTLNLHSPSPTPENQLTNWPIQLQLLNPASEVFDGADVVIAADCTAFSLPDFYKRFTKNKAVIVFCPKLDRVAELYIEKLAEIFTLHPIRSLTLLRMQVPCCGGVSVIVNEALKKSGQNIDYVEYVVHFDGTLR